MSLRMLADATDGLAIVGSNDIAGGLKRVVADLTSYYLLGYYSNAKLDGKFHSITVRVKRPGVQVRARRGYLERGLRVCSIEPGSRWLCPSPSVCGMMRTEPGGMWRSLCWRRWRPPTT
jgi:hypothetical protein